MHMKKIAIVTILSNNLGNRLQNYALQETISGLGYCVETLQKGHQNTNTSRFIKYWVKRCLKKDDWKFRRFDKRINWSPYSLAVQGEKEKIAEAYDYFVAGSDQVWNPNFGGTTDDSFLKFAPERKRIAYAASFGVDNIPGHLLEKYEDYLKGFSAISVREKQAVDMVEQFEGCCAEWVLDPTFLLPASRWKQIAILPKKEKYVLKYLLGEDQAACGTVIESLFGNIEVIDVKKLLCSHGKTIGPEEFLGLIENAQMVCTDSFHASVFSTIFEKPFVIFERADQEKDMSSRIDSLCDMLALHEHRFSSASFKISKVLSPNYQTTFALLEKEQQKAMQYLMNVLNI